MENNIELLKELEQFIGTEQYHRLTLFPLLATDGVAYLAEKAKAFWLIDKIASMIYTIDEHFMVAKVQSYNTKNGYICKIIIEDGNYNELNASIIDYTDLPTGDYKFFITDNVIMLPSEY